MATFSLAALKNTFDEVRVSVYAKNDTEKKVYEALSSKNWGASSTLLNDIAAETMEYDKFGFINDIVWASLDTDGKSWKQIFKSLTLVEFLIKNGSERFIESARDKLFKIKRLQDYNYYEGTVDKGSGCREKAKQIVELLASNETIRAEREKARSLRNKFGGVGSDSASSGGHYGGSYGGSSDSYSNQGSDSRDRDRDSRGGGGGGGRYGGDSYNDRSYSDRGDNRSNTTTNNTGRYGGGAYNSDKPPRYGDDAPTSNNDVDDVHIKPYKAKEADRSNTSTGGKLKVSIRKSVAEPAPTIAAAPAPQEVNLMGDDFDAFSSTPAPAQRAADDFDPFISAPAAAQAPTAPAAAAFDPFGMSAPAPAPAQAAPAFDPFMSAPAPAAAPAFDPFGQQQAHFGQPQPAYNAAPLQPQQQYGQFSTTPAAHYQQQAPQPPVQQQQQQQFRANPAPAAPVFQQQQQQQQQSADADFGDFEAAKPAAAPKAPAANKWGDLGSLVDLGGIAKNQAPAPKNDAAATAVNASYANSSFAGLDGFSKTPQNMANNGGRPLGYGGAPAGAAMAPRPMGGAPVMPMGNSSNNMMMGGGGYGGPVPPNMGGYGGPAPHNMGSYGAPAPNMGGYGGAPMGVPPQMMPPMGMPMGGGAPNPNMNMGGYGAPRPGMGAPVYGAAPMGGMAGQPGYPPQQYRPSGPGGF